MHRRGPTRLACSQGRPFVTLESPICGPRGQEIAWNRTLCKPTDPALHLDRIEPGTLAGGSPMRNPLWANNLRSVGGASLGHRTRIWGITKQRHPEAVQV